MSERGWCPFARQHRGPGREGPFGYPAGTRNQTVPVAIYSHRMGGHKRTLDNDQWRHENWVGVNFGIGRYVVGDIDQYSNIYDANWGQGIAGDVAKYDRANPILAALEKKRGAGWNSRPAYSAKAHSLDAGGVNVINASGPAIEAEDAGRDEPWPDPLVENSIMVHRWIVKEYNDAGIVFVLTDDTSIGHFQIDAVNRSHCPGQEHWFNAKKKILAGVNVGGSDVFVVHDRDAKFGAQANGWAGRTFPVGNYRQNARADYGLPPEAKVLRMHVRIKPPGAAMLSYGNGGGGFAALFRGDRLVDEIQVVMDKDGFIDFNAVGGPVTFEANKSTGFWT